MSSVFSQPSLLTHRASEQVYKSTTRSGTKALDQFSFYCFVVILLRKKSIFFLTRAMHHPKSFIKGFVSKPLEKIYVKFSSFVRHQRRLFPWTASSEVFFCEVLGRVKKTHVELECRKVRYLHVSWLRVDRVAVSFSVAHVRTPL